MKRLIILMAMVATAALSSGCADTPVATGGRVSSSYTGSVVSSGGIDPITQASIDESARQTQEDAQRVSDSITQQQNLDMMNQVNQEAAQASMDASNAAAQAATDAANAAAISAAAINP